MTHICVGNQPSLVQIMACRLVAPSHYLNQCCKSVNWSLSNNLQWNFNWKSYIFVQVNAIENVVCKMSVILSRPQCVKSELCTSRELCAWFTVCTLFDYSSTGYQGHNIKTVFPGLAISIVYLEDGLDCPSHSVCTNFEGFSVIMRLGDHEAVWCSW